MPMIATCASSRSRSPANGKFMKVRKGLRGGTVSGGMADSLAAGSRCRRRSSPARPGEDNREIAAARFFAARDRTADAPRHRLTNKTASRLRVDPPDPALTASPASHRAWHAACKFSCGGSYQNRGIAMKASALWKAGLGAVGLLVAATAASADILDDIKK